MSLTRSKRDAALQNLNHRDPPTDIAAWGRAWGFTPGEAAALVQQAARLRNQPTR